MPTHKMHMHIANEVNKYLRLDDDMVMIGSVLPDLTIDKKKVLVGLLILISFYLNIRRI